MNRISQTQCSPYVIYVLLNILVIIPDAFGSTFSATQESWTGGLPNSRPYVALWSDMFESSYAVDWSDTPDALTIVSGFEKTILWCCGNYPFTHFTPSDIDSDGDLDLFYLRNTAQVGWLENIDHEPDWVLHEIGQSIYQPKAMVANDFDGNGFPDLAVSSREDGLLVIYQLSEDRWEIENIDRQFYSGWDLETADINKDGLDDLVGISRIPGYICWWENPTSLNGIWDSHVIANLEDARNAILIIDFDGDGEEEVCALPENDFVSGIAVFRQGNDSRELWDEMQLGNWTDCVTNLAILNRLNDQDINVFNGLAIEQLGRNSPESRYFFLASDYVTREAIFSERVSSYSRFMCTGDIDGDSDMDVCIKTHCFENVDDKSIWITHNYLDTDPINTQITNPICFDIDGNGADELVYIESGSIWFVDHSRLTSRGELISHYFEPQVIQEWKRFFWKSEEPSGTSVSMFFRYNRQSDWIGPFTESIDLTEYESGGINQFQYKVILESENPEETPVLQSVTVEWE